MKILGLVAEYNPFHYGHKYHLEQSKTITNSDHTIAIISGSFQQRGEPSMIDKWTKAKMAIDNGVDLVLELPFIFSSQSAEFFAYGSIKLMDSLNIVNYLSFGSEIGELYPLKQISTIVSTEPKYYKERLKYYLSNGLAFSVSRSNAFIDYRNTFDIKDKFNYKEILNNPNNILGIEYLKALERINSNIIPFTIKRSGSDYKDVNPSNKYPSATSIRNLLKTNDLSSIKDLVPLETYYALDEYLIKYDQFNFLENYNQILLYLLRSINSEKLTNIMDVEIGLENRIISMANKYNNLKEIIDNIVTKRYPRSRIQRIFMHLLNDLDYNVFDKLSRFYPAYVRVLGSNTKGLNIINEIKKNTSLPIITKFADYKHLNNNILNEILSFDKKSTDLFFLGILNSKVLSNMDFYNSPYIKD